MKRSKRRQEDNYIVGKRNFSPRSLTNQLEATLYSISGGADRFLIRNFLPFSFDAAPRRNNSALFYFIEFPESLAPMRREVEACTTAMFQFV